MSKIIIVVVLAILNWQVYAQREQTSKVDERIIRTQYLLDRYILNYNETDPVIEYLDNRVRIDRQERAFWKLIKSR